MGDCFTAAPISWVAAPDSGVSPWVEGRKEPILMSGGGCAQAALVCGVGGCLGKIGARRMACPWCVPLPCVLGCVRLQGRLSTVAGLAGKRQDGLAGPPATPQQRWKPKHIKQTPPRVGGMRPSSVASAPAQNREGLVPTPCTQSVLPRELLGLLVPSLELSSTASPRRPRLLPPRSAERRWRGSAGRTLAP